MPGWLVGVSRGGAGHVSVQAGALVVFGVDRSLAQGTQRTPSGADFDSLLGEVVDLLPPGPYADGGVGVPRVLRLVGVDEEELLGLVEAEGEPVDLEIEPGQTRRLQFGGRCTRTSPLLVQIGHQLLDGQG